MTILSCMGLPEGTKVFCCALVKEMDAHVFEFRIVHAVQGGKELLLKSKFIRLKYVDFQ